MTCLVVDDPSGLRFALYKRAIDNHFTVLTGNVERQFGMGIAVIR